MFLFLAVRSFPTLIAVVIMPSTSTPEEVLRLSQRLSFCFIYTAFTGGLISNLLTILIFSRIRIFRDHRCTFYLIVESIGSLVILFLYFVVQSIQLNSGIDPASNSLFWCKVRPTLSQTFRLLIGSIVCLQAIDQYLSTHHLFSVRQLSTRRSARCAIVLFSTLSFLQSIPYVVFCKIVPPHGCVIDNAALLAYYSYFYYPILHGLLPVCVSSLFSVLAYRNVRHIVRRQLPLERRRLNRQLTAMIFVRVIFFVLLISPYTLFRIYLLSRNISPTNSIDYAVQHLISTIVGFLLALVYSVRPKLRCHEDSLSLSRGFRRISTFSWPHRRDFVDK